MWTSVRPPVSPLESKNLRETTSTRTEDKEACCAPTTAKNNPQTI